MRADNSPHKDEYNSLQCISHCQVVQQNDKFIFQITTTSKHNQDSPPTKQSKKNYCNKCILGNIMH